jgi:hypothetical protein
MIALKAKVVFIAFPILFQKTHGRQLKTPGLNPVDIMAGSGILSETELDQKMRIPDLAIPGQKCKNVSPFDSVPIV